MKINKKFKILIFISTFFFLLYAFFVGAQTSPQFLISWQSDSYVPDWYQGKIFPANGSRIDISFELLENGKIADISKTIVRWYVNNNLVINEKNGTGIKNYSFINNDVYRGNDIEVKITLPNYKGAIIDRIINIPVKSQEAVIGPSYFDNKVSTGKSVFYAWPFFFNIKNLNDLSFNWVVNGQKAKNFGQAPSVLNLNVEQGTLSGTKVDVNVNIMNSKNQMESASKVMQLEVN